MVCKQSDRKDNLQKFMLVTKYGLSSSKIRYRETERSSLKKIGLINLYLYREKQINIFSANRAKNDGEILRNKFLSVLHPAHPP